VLHTFGLSKIARSTNSESGSGNTTLARPDLDCPSLR
jgi:hypothetical protein